MALTLASSSDEPCDRPAPAAEAEALSFRCAPQQVEDLTARGVPFARIEDAIDATPFVHSHKSALWLLAWSLRDPDAQRRDAREMTCSFSAEQPRRRPPREGPRLAPHLPAGPRGS